MFTRIISGGQTGVDRAALDVALSLGLDCGGWCPQGRRAEDGPLSSIYPMQETPFEGYEQRTEWNIRDSDGTLILLNGPPDQGTNLTIELAQKLSRPFLILDMTDRPDRSFIEKWVKEYSIRVVNIAGPRESNSRGVYTAAVGYLRQLLS